jgi:anti-sigma factor RsiW
MSFDHDRITDLDLMAYADGRLDAARRGIVEAHLASDANARALVETFIAQNESLSRALDPIAAEPVPGRLKAVLERPRARTVLWPLLQAASVLGLAVLSGLGGWWLGASHHPVAATPPAFLAGLDAGASSATGIIGSLEPLRRRPAETRLEGAGLPGQAIVERAAPWFTDRVTVEVEAPALGESFASPELQRLVEIDGKPTVRFELAGPDGRALALYLQTRPSGLTPEIQVVDTAGGSTAYWQDGPLLWALTGDADGADIEALARRIGTGIELKPRLGTLDAEHTDLMPLPMTLAGG